MFAFAWALQDSVNSRTICNPDGTSRFWRDYAMMPHERRLSIRKPLDHLAYVSLPSDNGGIVLDVSEGGLGFHAIGRVEADGPIHFRFAIDSAAKTNAVGELAWIDETGKTGGLRFTQLPDEVREQIRVWADQSKANASVLDIPVAEPEIKAEVAPSNNADMASALDIPVAEPEIKAKVAPSNNADLASVFDIPVAEPEIEAKVAHSSNADLSAVVATRDPRLYNPKPPIYSSPINKLSMFPMGLNSDAGANAVAVPQSIVIRHPIAAVGLTIALAFLVSIGIFSYVTTSRAGELLFVWGEKMWGGSYSQSIRRDSPPPANSAPDSPKSAQR